MANFFVTFCLSPIPTIHLKRHTPPILTCHNHHHVPMLIVAFGRHVAAIGLSQRLHPLCDDDGGNVDGDIMTATAIIGRSTGEPAGGLVPSFPPIAAIVTSPSHCGRRNVNGDVTMATTAVSYVHGHGHSSELEGSLVPFSHCS